MVFNADDNDGASLRTRRAFASLSLDGTQQLTVLQWTCPPPMSTPYRVVIPLPVEGSSGGGECRIIDLAHYGMLFEDLYTLYPDMEILRTTAASPRVSTIVSPQQEACTIFRSQASLFEGFLNRERDGPLRDRLQTWYHPTEGWHYLALAYPTAGTTACLAYVHPARRDRRLFIPTKVNRADEEPGEPKWDDIIFTVNTTDSGGSESGATRINTAFRWDLIGGFSFPQIATIRRILTNVQQPNHDAFLPTQATDLHAMPYIGGDGAIFEDRTNLRIVRFHSYGFQTLPVVNGCLLTKEGQRAAYHFGGSHIVFEEEPGRIKMIDDVGRPTEIAFYIYPDRVKRHQGQCYLEFVSAG